MRLQNKIVLATGAGNPCVQATVTGFAREGANCAVTDAEAAKAEQLAAQVRSLGRRALALKVDVAKKSEIEEAVRATVAEFGRIDVLLNGSLNLHVDEFLNFTEEAFNNSIEQGPRAYFLASQAVGRLMAEQRSGKIINLSTTDARVASGESTGNSAAHSSIESMTRVIAQALGFYGINVNSLVFGPMESMSTGAEEAGERLRRIPLGRLSKPDDIVGAALFLATDDANFVAGESLYVDAGYSNAAVTEDNFRPVWGRRRTENRPCRSRRSGENYPALQQRSRLRCGGFGSRGSPATGSGCSACQRGGIAGCSACFSPFPSIRPSCARPTRQARGGENPSMSS